MYKDKAIVNHGPVKTAKELGLIEYNRQTLPGDVDYVGVCQS